MNHKKYIGGEFRGTMAERFALDIENAIVERSHCYNDFTAESIAGHIEWLKDKLIAVIS